MKKLKLDKVIKYFVILLVIAGAGVGAYYGYNRMTVAANAQNTAREMTAKVVRGNLEVVISGTGTVQPISSYDIVPLVKGNIINAPFEEGMEVKAGDLLYKIDDSDLSYNIEKAQNNIEKLKINNQESVDSMNNLVVYAPCDGRITNFTINEGEQIGNNSKIADVVDDKHITATIPYHGPQVEKIKVGQKAQLAVQDFMWYIDGEVKYVSNTAKPVAGGGALYNVEIEIDNPGAFAEGMEVTGIVKGPDGDIFGASQGTTRYSNNKPVFAQTAGKVKEVYVKNDEWVKAGQKILALKNDNLNNTIYKNSLDLKDLQLSLDAQKKQLNNYNILSPINGTVIKKYYKAGDTINNNNANTILMTVADMTKMVFTIDVDELDVAKVALGQKVNITADAIPDTNFSGEITSVAMVGNSQNGVTTYPVQVTIKAPGQLKPGMNVNAQILVESKKDVLYLPIAAVTKVGDKTFVYVKDEGTGNNLAGIDKQQGGQSPRKAPDDLQNGQQRAARRNENGSRRQDAITSGRQLREVVVGINNDNYIEIVSGLNEGETVYLPSVSTNNNTGNNSGARNMPGGGMGFPGGGMGFPDGGASGRTRN